ncbi:type IV toxin-antitoxin system AbiEi family antitoxin domain-containing protein [Arthrobacter sp. C152]
MTPQPVRVPALPCTGNLWRTGQLHEMGLNSKAIRALVLDGKLVRLRHGCYIRAELWEKQTAPLRSRQLIRAHAHGTLTTSAGGYVYSHTSAARLHGLSLWDVDDLVHLLLPGNPSSERLGKDVRGHTRAWTEREVVTLDGLRVTSLERTVVDCAMMLGYRQSLVLMDHALRLGADKPLIERMADGLQGRRGVRTLRLALAHADPRSESAGETLTRELLIRLKLPLPEPQVAVATRAGQYRLDFAWKEKKVALEFDGKTKYFDYKPTGEVLFQERQREKALTENGWTFLRVTWADLFREHEFKARVLDALRL